MVNSSNAAIQPFSHCTNQMTSKKYKHFMQTFSLAHTFIIDAQISNLILSTAKFILKIFIFSIMCSILNFNYSSPFKASLFTIRISHLNALIGSNGFFMVHLFVAISINSYIHKLI